MSTYDRAALLARLTPKHTLDLGALGLTPDDLSDVQIYARVYDPEADGPPVVELDRHGPVTLGQPRHSLARALFGQLQRLREDTVECYAYVGCAAMLECWPAGRTWPTTPQPRRLRRAEDYVERGGDIYDALHDCAAIEAADLDSIAPVALRWVNHCMARSYAGQSEARDFSGAPKGG